MNKTCDEQDESGCDPASPRRAVVDSPQAKRSEQRDEADDIRKCANIGAVRLGSWDEQQRTPQHLHKHEDLEPTPAVSPVAKLFLRGVKHLGLERHWKDD